MSTRHQRQAVVVVEGLGNILAKRVSCATRRYSPTAPVIWVGPKQIAHGSFMWHFLYAVEGPDVVERVNAGGEAAVQTEDLVVNQGGEREVVEEVCEVFPDIGVAVLAEALVVEAVYLSDLAGFVVTAKNGDALGVSDLERDQEGHSLDREIATVNVVACGS